MICISIMEESRKLALADMVNARRQCDLLELRLDRFEKSADIKNFIAKKPKPVIMTCRRVKDGGHWDGSETERLALLRQCIIDKADYVEIELDAADQIRPFPGCKRVISYTNLAETPENLQDIYDECFTKHPDVVKLVCNARSPEEAWPLVQIVGKASVPTVVVGVGKPGIMLTILGKRVGAPWTYAALEKGMETYPGQPTIHDLEKIYHYSSVQKGVRFIGVVGFSPREIALTATLNAAFQAGNTPARCLPLSVGNPAFFRKVIDAVKLAALVVDPAHQVDLQGFAQQHEKLAEKAGAVDLLSHQADKSWQGHYLLGRAALAALEKVLAERHAAEFPLKGRMVLILGTNGPTRALAYAVRKREGVVIIAGRDKEAAQEIANQNQCRCVPYEAIYSTSHDVLIVCENEAGPVAVRPNAKPMDGAVHASILKGTTPLLDLTGMPLPTPLVQEALSRGVPVVPPRQLFAEYAELLAKALMGQPLAPATVQHALEAAFSDAFS